MYIEPLITKSKDDATHSRRVVFSYLNDKVATAELFKEVSPKVADRPGGYTRIIKLATRLGDSADMAMIELVDFNELLLTEAKPKKARRSRRAGAKKTEAAAPVAEAKVEEPKAEAAPEAQVADAPEAKAEEPAAEEKKDDNAEGEEKKA